MDPILRRAEELHVAKGKISDGVFFRSLTF